MFKKKRLYIIVIVIATLLLIADVVFYKMTSDIGQVPASGMPSGFSGGSLPEGFSTDQMPSGFSADNLPEGFSTDQMPSGFSADGSGSTDGSGFSQPPTGFGMGGSTEGSTDSSTDGSAGGSSAFGNFDMSAVTDVDSDAVSTMTTVRKICIPVAILCIILDAISIFMLIRISRRKKKEAELAAASEEDTMTAKEREEYEAKMAVEAAILKRSKSKKRTIALVAVLILAMISLAVVSKYTQATRSTSGTSVEEKIVEAQAESGSIHTTLNGTGTLNSGETTSVTVPGTVTIVSYAVSEGDVVKSGDLIATVDKTTVLSSIAELQSTLDELDEELESLSDEDSEDCVSATVAGRVIAVYAQEGAAVTDTMYEYGSLMLISLDGFLAVDFESELSLTVGDSVTVTASDGIEYTGHVARALNGSVTVTVSDNGPALGDKVSAAAEDGTKIGEGELYIHSCQKITGFTGTIDAVKVEAGDAVDEGDTLYTLSDTGYAENYTKLLQEREVLEGQMAVLMKAYMTGGIYAEADGIISGLLEVEEEKEETAKEQTEETGVSAVETKVVAVTVSSDTTAPAAIKATTTAATTKSGAFTTVTGLVSLASELTGDTEETTPEKTEEQTEVQQPSSDQPSGDQPSGDQPSGDQPSGDMPSGDQPSGDQPSSDQPSGDQPSGDQPSGDTPSGDQPSGDQPSGDQPSGNQPSGDQPSGDVPSGDQPSGDVPSGDGFPGATDDTSGEMTTETLAAWLLSLDQSELNQFLNTLDYNTLKTLYEAVRAYESGEATANNGGNTQPGGSQTDGQVPSGGMDFSGMNGAQGGAGMSGAGSQDFSGMSGAGAFDTSSMAALAGTTTTEEDSGKTEKSYSMRETEIGTLTPNEAVTIDISIDELDIRKVTLGASAEVTLDALSGQHFEGTITHIDTEGTTSSGNTKYAVTVSIERTADMKDGMNANASMVLSTKEDVLTIPVSALEEEGTHVYVYTGYQESKDELTGKTEVTCGVSDGENVEILSGIEAGDTIYYRYADTITYNFK